jgi:hypothetical protein
MPKKPLRILLTPFVLFVSMTLVQCRASEKNRQDPKAAFESVVKKKLGERYTVSYNTSRTYALCQQSREADHMQRTFNYVVVHLATNKVVHEGSFSMGSVQWHDEKSIEVLDNSSSGRDDGKTNEKKVINIESDQF